MRAFLPWRPRDMGEDHIFRAFEDPISDVSPSIPSDETPEDHGKNQMFPHPPSTYPAGRPQTQGGRAPLGIGRGESSCFHGNQMGRNYCS